MRGVEFPGHKHVKVAMERNPVMVYKNHTAGCLPCQHGTAKNLQIRWRHKGTAAPLLELAAPLPERPPPPGTPPPPGMPPALPRDTDGNESYQIEGIPSKSVY